MQQRVHLHLFAPICTYAAFKKNENTQINMENIYIWPIYIFSSLNICIYGLYICIYSDLYPCAPTELHIYIYIYRQIDRYIYIYIYIYICSTRPQITVHTPLALQKAAVSMIQKYNGVLHKLLQTSIRKHLDIESTVLTKQHYQLLLTNLTQQFYMKVSFGYLYKPKTGLIGQCF